MWRRRTIRSWLLEISLGVLAAGLGLFFVLNPAPENGDGAPIAVEAVAGALAFAGLVLFRREHPVTLTLVLIPFGILLGLPMGFTPVALFAVALHRGARVVIALAGLHAVLVALTY